MIDNARIADLIRENRADEISEAIAEGDYFKMQTFSQALITLVLTGRVDREVAANASSNRHDFLVALERAEKLHAVKQTNDTESGDDRPAQIRPAAPVAEPKPPAETAVLRVAQPQ